MCWLTDILLDPFFCGTTVSWYLDEHKVIDEKIRQNNNIVLGCTFMLVIYLMYCDSFQIDSLLFRFRTFLAKLSQTATDVKNKSGEIHSFCRIFTVTVIQCQVPEPQRISTLFLRFTLTVGI